MNSECHYGNVMHEPEAGEHRRQRNNKAVQQVGVSQLTTVTAQGQGALAAGNFSQ
jgi:hypothetical protein